ncbi:hypothetical protein [Fodinibius sp. Rm-B-1B1-1]|uniref:hypothetical protein n=1 Tax=Fodinibius alkaliphilus TaxID=3140241 RepID=UPI00315A735D
MIRYLLQTHLKNKTLWAWPGIVLLFVASIIVWGDVSATQNSYSFIIHIGDLQIPSGMFINQFLISLITLIAIIGLPSPLAKNLKPARASLLLSKPISRTEMFLSDYASMLLSVCAYTGITILLLSILTIVKAGIFPYQLFLGIFLFLPLIILAYYITISLFLLFSNSYLAGVILGYFLTGFSSLFLNIDQFLKNLGWEGTFADILITTCSYLIPSAGGFEQITSKLLMGGFSTIDGNLLVFSVVTYLPFGLASYYFLHKKEF